MKFNELSEKYLNTAPSANLDKLKRMIGTLSTQKGAIIRITKETSSGNTLDIRIESTHKPSDRDNTNYFVISYAGDIYSNSIDTDTIKAYTGENVVYFGNINNKNEVIKRFSEYVDLDPRPFAKAKFDAFAEKYKMKLKDLDKKKTIDESTSLITPQQYNAMLFNYNQDYSNPEVAYFSYVVNEKGKNVGNIGKNVFTFEMDHIQPVGIDGWARIKDPKLRHDFFSKAELVKFILNVNGAVQRLGGRFLKTSKEVLTRLMSPLNESIHPPTNIVEYSIMLNKSEKETPSLISDLRAYLKSLKTVFQQEYKTAKAEWKKKTSKLVDDADMFPEPMEKIADIDVDDEGDTKLVKIRIEDPSAADKLLKKFKTRIEKVGFLDTF